MIFYNSTTGFGDYRPTILMRWAIRMSQKSPQNWIGQQLAQLLRKFVLRVTDGPIDVEVGRIRMRCCLHKNNSEKRFVFMPWRFEGVERTFLRKVLPSSGTFVDIGANVGIWSLDAVTHLNEKGRIVAIEPNPVAHGRLNFNLAATCGALSQGPRVDALQVGVSDIEGIVDLHLDASNLGGSSIYKRKAASSNGGAIQILCKPLLLILDECGITSIDALKIDIEGAEDLALVPFLTHSPESLLPRYIFMENSARLWHLNLIDQLTNRDYQICQQTKGNLVYQLVSENGVAKMVSSAIIPKTVAV